MRTMIKSILMLFLVLISSIGYSQKPDSLLFYQIEGAPPPNGGDDPPNGGEDPPSGGCTFTVYCQSTVNVTKEAGYIDVPIAVSKSSCRWTAKPSGWATVSPSSGTGAGTVRISYSANNTGSTRTAFLQIAGKYIDLVQSAAPACILNIYPNETVKVRRKAGSFTLSINSNCSWSIDNSRSWISLSKSSGHGSAKIEVNYTENKNYSSREAILDIELVQESYTMKRLSVKQDAGCKPFEPEKNITISEPIHDLDCRINNGKIQARDGITLNNSFSYSTAGNAPVEFSLDPSFIIDVDYQSEINPANRPINTSLEPGSIPGSFNVSPSGAFNYTIPLDIPAGIAGMQPALGLAYNSMGGNSTLGIGWMLTGLSAITRTPESEYYANMIDGVDLDEYDRFALDGSRLMVINNGTYGANNTEYRTEDNNFSKVTSLGQAGTGPLWFKVESKSGTTLEYGSTTDSRLSHSGTVIAWRLKKVTDPHGNYIKFNYKQKDGEIWIKSIEYTGNSTTGKAPINKIHFYYSQRADQGFSYIGGAKLPSTVLLRSVKVESNGEFSNEYKLHYSQDFYSHLAEVEKIAPDGSKLNSTLVNWGKASATNFTENSINTNHQSDFSKYYLGDFNGDGRTDYLVKLRDSNSQYNRYKIFLADSMNISFREITGEFSFTLNTNTFKDFYIGDIDNDGKDDIIKRSRNGNMDELTWLCVKNDILIEPNGLIEHHSRDGCIVKTGDFDGDGATEFIYLLEDLNFYKYYSDIWTWTGATGLDWNSPDKIEITDFNGDGIKELMAIKGDSCNIYQKKGSSFENIYSGTFPSNTQRIYQGDFNGDGKIDIMTYEATAPTHERSKLRFSTGKDFVLSEHTPPIGAHNYMNNKIGDFNGDGKDDVLYTWKSASQNYITIYYSLGNGKFSEETHTVNYNHCSNISSFKIMDINGDGQDDLLNANLLSSTPLGIFTFHPHEQKHLVQSITNGFNRQVKIEYAPLSDKDVYSNGNNIRIPANTLHNGFKVVKNITSPNALGKHMITTYQYEKVMNTPKGFGGFSKVIITNNTAGIKTTTNYLLGNYSALYKKTTTTETISGNLISRQTAEYGTKGYDDNDKRYFSYPVKITSYDEETGISNTKEFLAYDDYGNVTSIKESKGNDLVIETTNTYKMVNAWCPSKIKNMTVKSTLTGEVPFSKTSHFSYNSYGDLTSKQSNGVSLIYSYNDYGNLVKQTRAAAGTDSSSVSYSYDNSQRFITSQSNALGQLSYFEYNKMGKLVSKTGITGLSTQYEYDSWGKLKSTLHPNGKKTIYSAHWAGNGTSEYYTVEQTDGLPEVKTWYNKAGRSVKAETTGFKGKMLAETMYNAKGEVVKSIAPYYESEGYTNAHVTEYEYYPDGKLHKTISNGLSSIMDYNGKSISQTLPSGIEHTSTMNDAGMTIQAKNDGTDIFYSYYSHGQVKEITAPGSAIKIYYDDYGFKDSIVDPDAGVYDYDYNALGQLVSVSTSIGSYCAEYDVAGRLSKQTEDGKEIQYSYITEGNGLNQLDKVTDAQGTALDMDYDSFGRPVKLTKRVGDKSFDSYTVYDDYGRPTEITYPGGLKIYYIYKTETGELEEIQTEDGKSLWKLLDKNSHGQLTQYAYGNGLVSDMIYKNDMSLHKILTDTIQQLEYDFDVAHGRLNSRKGSIKGVTENFTYHEHNQLAGVSSSQKPELNMALTYQDGCITSKTGIGSYQYNGNQAHAVSGIDTTGTGYNPGNQNITYTSFGKVAEIIQGSYKIVFSYTPQQQRETMEVYENNVLQRKVYYAGSYELHEHNGISTELNYISSPAGLVAVYKKESSQGDWFYIHKDHLGSVHTITDSLKQPVARYYYNAWGERKCLNTQGTDFASNSSIDWMHRGFTGHEHIPEVDLINMNGRMYDPALGMFLSPDPFVQSPANPVNFNRYAYVLNNPLIYTDPSGLYAQKPIVEGAWVEGYGHGGGFGVHSLDNLHAMIDNFFSFGGYGGPYSRAKMWDNWTYAYNLGLTRTGFSKYMKHNGKYELNGPNVRHFEGKQAKTAFKLATSNPKDVKYDKNLQMNEGLTASLDYVGMPDQNPNIIEIDGNRFYQVQEGDWLYKINREVFNNQYYISDWFEWNDIKMGYDSNGSYVPLIYPGDILVVPPYNFMGTPKANYLPIEETIEYILQRFLPNIFIIENFENIYPDRNINTPKKSH